MDPNPRRKFLTHAVAGLIHEAGFGTVQKGALEILVEVFQSHLTELGRTTKVFTEGACRVEPTIGDFTLALVDMGIRVDPVGLRNFARRTGRIATPAPLGLPPPKVPQILTAGKRKNLPPYIPDYYPPMPDPHAYIRTPTHKQPLTDYAACREKMSQQKRDLERSLTKFNARTLPCFHIFPDPTLFPLIGATPVTYLNALIPRDQIFEEDQSLPTINLVKKEVPEVLPRLNDEDDQSQALVPLAPTTTESTWELIDNPFLKTPRPPIHGKKTKESRLS